MSEAIAKPPLLVGSVGLRSSGWWGMAFLVMSEASVFAYLFFAYFYYAVHFDYRPWPPYGPPTLTYSIPETVLLFLATAAMWWSDRRARVAVDVLAIIGPAIATLFGLGYIALGLLDWSGKPFTLSSSAYSSIYFAATGVHIAHVVVGVLIAAAVLAWSLIGYFNPVRHAPLSIAALYWYFLSATWAALFFVLYITPYLGR
jgi:cytochrome c oxidase subunit 3